MKKNKWIVRIVAYAIGLLILAFGVAFSVNSNLGVSPANSFPYVVSLILNTKMGNCVTVIFVCYILLQIVILRKDFQWINLSQIVFSTLFGKFVDFAKLILGDFCIPTYAGRLLMLAISVVLIAIGISMYMGAKLVNMPTEGLASAIASKLPGKEFHQVKVMVDCASVSAGIILSVIFLGGLQGIREGTIISAIVIGKVIPYANKLTRPLLQRFCFS
jgi:uncharacterized membrane protein YczE